MLFNELQNKLIRRQIAFICYLSHYRFIGIVIVIIVIMTYIKKPVSLKPERLMDLKIKANCFLAC
jgi:hypothetical protein